MDKKHKPLSFVPGYLLTKIAAGIEKDRFNSVVVFADVSGFTAMSEKLAEIGKEGAEELTAILNNYFTVMIGIIEQAGGFVGKFGGDAMTIFFPVEKDEDANNAVLNAVNVSLNLQREMKNFRDIETKSGKFSLGMKIGISAGRVLFKMVGDREEHGCEFVFAGIALDQSAEAEHHGKAGDVIVEGKLIGNTGITGTDAGDDFVRVDPDLEIDTAQFSFTSVQVEPDWSKIAQDFIDPPVYRRMELGLDSVGEIRRVSVIFISFSGLDYDNDPQVALKLDKMYDWVYGLVKKYDGSINKVDMGDKGSKIIITFGTPVAHENDEELSVRCAYELVSNKAMIDELGIAMKMGIATGIVFAGEVGAPTRQEYTVMGTTVNLSARIMSKTESNQLLIDETTWLRIKDKFETSQPKFYKFKGIAEPLPTYEVSGYQAEGQQKKSGRKVDLVGRDNEIELSRNITDKVLDKKLQILLIKGEAGIGKSALAGKIIESLREKDFQFSGGEAFSYAQNSPYLIWVSIFKQLFPATIKKNEKPSLELLKQIIQTVDPENTFRLPIIAAVLGIECEENDITKHFDGQLRQENLFDFTVQWLKYLAERSPFCLIFEDAHWIDNNSMMLLSYLVRNLTSLPVFILFLKRSNDQEMVVLKAIEKHPLVTKIELSELDKQSTERLILSAKGVDKIDPELLEFIYESSHGNPSYTEQFIDNLESIGKLQVSVIEDEGKVLKSVGDLKEIEVPDSLSSLIMSQLDRLQPETKLTVKVAAAIGRQFHQEILTGAYPVDMKKEDILKAVSDLDHKDIVSSATTDDLDYIFKNMLTRDVAYESLLFSHRREYHKRIGYCIEEKYQETLTEHFNELAWHFSFSDVDEKAIDYSKKAGNKAFDIYANESALEHYTKALERAQDKQFIDERYHLLNMRSKVYSVLGQSDLQKKDLDELLLLADERKDAKGKVSVLSNLALYHYRGNDSAGMKDAIDQAYEVLKETDFPFGRITINAKAGQWNFINHKYDEALNYYELCRKEASEYDDMKGLSVALTNCGLTYKAIGKLDQALKYYNESIEIDRKAGNKKSEAINLGNIGVIYHQQGDYESAAESYQKALELAREIGSKQIQSYYLGNLANIFQQNGERDKALQSFEELLEISKKMGYFKGQVLALGNIGNWYQEFGDIKKAIEYFDSALEIATRYNLQGLIPFVLLNKGLAFHCDSKLSEAKQILEQGLEKTLEIKSKPMEDYARRYLGFVLVDQNNLDAARDQFNQAMDIAKAIGSKASIASAKVGLGLIQFILKGDTELVEEGIAEAEKLGDNEVTIKGLIFYARLQQERNLNEKARNNLINARDHAVRGGYRCDLLKINKLLGE